MPTNLVLPQGTFVMGQILIGGEEGNLHEFFIREGRVNWYLESFEGVDRLVEGWVEEIEGEHTDVVAWRPSVRSLAFVFTNETRGTQNDG